MPESDEVEVIDYLDTLWKWKLLILVGTLVVSSAAFAVSMITSRTFEARVLLLITGSKIARLEGGEGAGKPEISPEAFEAMIKSQALALQAIQQFGMDKEPFAMTPTKFLNNIISIKPQRGTNLLILTAILPDPKLAAAVANFVAQKAVELNARLNQADTVSTKEFIQQQRDQARLAMETAQATLTEFQESANLETLRVEQSFFLQEKLKLAQQDSDDTHQLKGLESAVAELGRALTKQEQLLSVNKSIFSDPSMLAAVQERGAMDLKSLSSVQLKSQEINNLYQSLQLDLINRQTMLASLKSQLDHVASKLKENEAKLISINRRIANTEARLEELTRNYSLAKAAYELFAKKFDEAAISVGSRVTELKILDPAVASITPRGRNVMRNVALAGAVALMTCVMLVFFLEYLQSVKRRHETIPVHGSS
ncbi:MAG: hypothetical protein KGL31_07205 [candidate division NC10 bacterium]|nr:hypothetical protein [candidate division NC10 bacterium]MDE2321689.1 hypothetical protein [candidate division NC10 bacterium]